MILTPTILLHEVVPFNHLHRLCIETHRGVYVGTAFCLALSADQALPRITTWHPVPRWMSPAETLRAFASP